MDSHPTGTAAAQIDGQAMLAEAWNDIYAAKIGLAQMLTLRVIFRYSLALNRAAAWIPHRGVFQWHTGMDRKESGLVLAQLESFGMIESEEAPLMDVLPSGNYPDGCVYKYFPRRVRAWSINPRIADKRHLESAAIIDRWLLAFNARGGSEAVDLFPPLWNHADTLAAWSARADEAPRVAPAPLPQQSAQPPIFARATGSGPAAGSAIPRPPTGWEEAENEALGKNPKLGEKPQAPAFNEWNDLNERQVSHLPQSRAFNRARPLGKNPKRTSEADERQAHWPSLERERSLMRQLNILVDRWYAPEMAAKVKDDFGGMWRCRIRKLAFGVDQAMFLAEAQWAELEDLGKFLNLQWKRFWKAHVEQLASRPAASYDPDEELDPAAVRAEIAASLGEGSEG